MFSETKLSYEFAPYRLDAGDRLLYRNGQPVSLPPKVIDTLLVLVENNGHVVEKGVLIAKVWPGVVVEENNLTQNVSLLRKTLGDGNDRKFIETIPRRGYRFVAPVKAVSDTPEPPPIAPKDRRLRWAGAALLLALILIAVLVLRRAPSVKAAPTLRQLTTNSTELPVTASAISPDGKYLAYADAAGIHLKFLKTGETRVLPGAPVLSVITVRWFPDGARLLVSGLSKQESGSGIRIFSLLGNSLPGNSLPDSASQKISNDGMQAAGFHCED